MLLLLLSWLRSMTVTMVWLLAIGQRETVRLCLCVPIDRHRWTHRLNVCFFFLLHFVRLFVRSLLINLVRLLAPITVSILFTSINILGSVLWWGISCLILIALTLFGSQNAHEVCSWWMLSGARMTFKQTTFTSAHEPQRIPNSGAGVTVTHVVCWYLNYYASMHTTTQLGHSSLKPKYTLSISHSFSIQLFRGQRHNSFIFS